MKPIYWSRIKARLTEHLKPILDTDALLVSDSNPSYHAFCQAENITHEAVNLSQGQRVIKQQFSLKPQNSSNPEEIPL